MKLLVFSDIHGDMAALGRLMEIEADYYIAAGDLVSWGRNLERCGPVLGRRAGRVYVLPGNHESAEQIASLAAAFGLEDFHGKTVDIGAGIMAGLGYSNPTPFNTPGEYTEKELAERLAPFAEVEPRVLVCHCPPWQTALDQVGGGVHAGSRSVREFIEKHQPEYFLCGHIHESEGATAEIGRTHGVNVGKRGYLLEL